MPLQRRRLVELCRCEGQAVKVGQVLGRQDDAEEVSALHELEINNEQLARDLDRAKRDRDKSDAAKTEYEQRSTQFEQSKSRISAQKARIDSLVLRAPLDGMVLRRDGEVGEIVGPTDVLFWVGPPAPMQVVAEINEEEITRIAAPRFRLPYFAALAAAHLNEQVSALTRKPPKAPLAGVRMAKYKMFFNPAKAIRELGLPQTPPKQALADAVEWFRRNGYAKHF